MPKLAIKTIDGLTVYGVARRPSDLAYWNTSGTPAFEAFNAGNWTNYAIAATKAVVSANVAAEYSIDVPTFAQGTYSVEFYSQVGGSPAVTDGVPPWVIEGILWNGSDFTDLGQIANATLQVVGGTSSQVTGIQNQTAVLISTLEPDPDHPGLYRLTAAALANAPSGGAIPGYMAINHNTGGTDALTILSLGGQPVTGATIRVFLKSSYASNPITAQCLGSTTTDNLGHWLQPVFVPPGATYAIIVSAIGDQTQEVDVTV